MGAAVAAWLANPQNEALLLSMIAGAAQGIQRIYTAWELQSLADLEAAVKTDRAQLDADVETMDKDIDARDEALEADLDKPTS